MVVPTLLTGAAEIEEQVERLEIHYLANPDGDLRFALLSDWRDAPAERMPEDDRLLAAAVDGIARLNARTAPRSPAARASSCSIADASGTRARARGWAGSASAGSSTS